MSDQFTENQRRAIESRGGTLLVSAAAGSGKTRVLTERLLHYVTDPVSPVDIDRFLVITFTRAAAAELRGRIMGALAACAAERPGDMRIRRQQSLCCRAPIGTIHSFCSSLIREYSQALGVSPAFTVLDEDRENMMKRSIASRILDRRYERIDADEGFRQLVDSVGAGRDDSRLQSTLLELYDKLQSHPYPEDWAAQQAAAFALEGVTDAGETVWGKELLSDALADARFWSSEMDGACAEITGADEKLQKAYGAAFSDAAEQLRAFCRAAEQGWDRACEFAKIGFARLGPLKNYDDAAQQARLKAVWNNCKKAAAALAETFSAPSAEQLDDLRAVSPAMDALLELTVEFERAYAAEKSRRGVLDFSDLEHLAARLLVDRETGNPTPAAAELSRRYQEIMVDEYQDVNAVQELIFRAVSREGRNLFLVGDVKQSIYRFRLADPQLFLEKYTSFAPYEDAPDGAPRRILLQENFRSRRGVLDAANLVFGGIMSRGLGELDYDADAALRFGAQGYDPALDSPAEFHLLDPVGAEEDAPAADELEARFIAQRILAMMRDGTPVTENGVRRRCDWGDFVLLMRAPGGKGPTFHRVLAEAGIPVDSQLGGGFFKSLEVAVTVDLLAVIDNPHADIPLISVLRSPAFNFSGDELSAIRAADRNSDYYGALCAAAAAGDRKSAEFLRKLEDWRALAPETELDTLVWRLCTETGLLAICAAMRDGETRRRNLMHLFEYARTFSATGYRGVYRFVQWLQRMSERGEEPDVGVDGKAVRILSIHKSKGLEFPFVFLCDLSHYFNQTDARACVLLHNRLGLGPKRIDDARGVEYPTLARRAIARRLTDETLSEEMRVLYVGMTRAREKLILSCVRKNAREMLDDLRLTARWPMPAELLRGMSSFAPWIASAALAQPETLPITIHSGADLPADAAESAAPSVAPAQDENADLAALREKLDFVYPWAGSVDLPSKLTATELKDPFEADEDAAALSADPPSLRFRRAKPGEARALTAAQRGTATHAFLQYVDFSRTGSRALLRAEAERLTAEGRIDERESAAVDLAAVEKLFASPLGRQMRTAAELRREFRFQLLCDAAEYFPGAAPGDEILLQGVVDCCFFTPDGGITVVDYKTDRVSAEQVPERAAHYRGQLAAYARALEEIFERPVTRCVLWFLHTGTEYEISLQTQ